MKRFLFLCLMVVSAFAGPEADSTGSQGLQKFKGRVTAVNSNGYQPGLSFTAVDAEGHIKMFYISTLEHLELNDRVELTYRTSEKFPLDVTHIRFLQPAKQ